MDNATGAATVLLKLHEPRTESTLRQARAWFAFECHPRTTQDVLRPWLGPGHEGAPISNGHELLGHGRSASHAGRHPGSDRETDPDARREVFARYLERQQILAANGKQRSYLESKDTAIWLIAHAV
jgi:hypothetical protein